MPRIILSTIGTSLLTQQLKRDDPTEKTWYNQLMDTANTPTSAMASAIARENKAASKSNPADYFQFGQSTLVPLRQDCASRVQKKLSCDILIVMSLYNLSNSRQYFILSIGIHYPITVGVNSGFRLPSLRTSY